jgi:hypothetical protein
MTTDTDDQPVVVQFTSPIQADVIAGFALGTALTIFAVMNGIRVPGLEVALSVFVTWLLLCAAMGVAVGLLRRHRKTIAQHGRRGAAVGWRASRDYVAARPEPEAVPQPAPAPVPAPGPAPEPGAKPTYSFGAATQRAAWPVDDPQTAHSRARHMSTDGQPWVVTEYPPGGGPGRTVATYIKGKPAPSSTQERNTTVGDTRVVNDNTGWDAPLPQPGPPRTGPRMPARGGTYSAEWAALVTQTADFEPEDDGHLLQWMGAEISGIAAYAEALTEVYETCVNSLGLDPISMAATHDVADAVADASGAMSLARQKFAAHYAEVIAFAARGGKLPYNGRWVTGEGGY